MVVNGGLTSGLAISNQQISTYADTHLVRFSAHQLRKVNMTIEVKEAYVPYEDQFVCVSVDGFCNHADSSEEIDEFTHGVDYSDGDILSHQDSIMVCRKCRSWKFVDGSDTWYKA